MMLCQKTLAQVATMLNLTLCSSHVFQYHWDNQPQQCAFVNSLFVYQQYFSCGACALQEVVENKMTIVDGRPQMVQHPLPTYGTTPHVYTHSPPSAMAAATQQQHQHSHHHHNHHTSHNQHTGSTGWQKGKRQEDHVEVEKSNMVMLVRLCWLCFW
jgi:hypothetical protein